MDFFSRSFTRPTIGLFAHAATAFTLVLGAAAWRASMGPIDTPPPDALIQVLLEDAAPGWRVETSGASFDFGAGAFGGVVLRDARVTDAEGREALKADEFELGIAFSPALNWRDIVSVSAIGLSGAEIRIEKDADGAVHIGEGVAVAAFENPDAAGEEASFSLASLEGAPHRATLTNARIIYRDHERGAELALADADLTVSHGFKGLRAEGEAVLESAGGRARVNAAVASDGATTLTIIADSVNPARLAALHDALAPLAQLDAPVTCDATLKLDPGGALKAASGTAALGAGTVRPAGEAPVAFHAAEADFTLDFNARQFSLRRATITAPEGRAAFTAQAQGRPDGRYSVAITTGAFAWNGDGDGQGAAARAGTLIAIVDADKRSADAASLRIRGLQLKDGSGRRMAARKLTIAGRADLSADFMEVAGVVLEDASLAGPDGSFAVKRLAGNARIDIAARRVGDVSAVLESLEVVDANGGLLNAARADASGAYDWGAGLMQVSSATFDGATGFTRSGSADVARLSAQGRLDLTAERGDGIVIALDGVRAGTATEPDALTLQRADLRGALDWRSGRADLTEAVLQGVAAQRIEGAVAAARLSATGAVDISGRRVDGLVLSADALNANDHENRRRFSVARADLGANLDWGAGHATGAELTLEAIEASDPAGSRTAARIVATGAVDLTGRRVDGLVLSADALNANDHESGRRISLARADLGANLDWGAGYADVAELILETVEAESPEGYQSAARLAASGRFDLISKSAPALSAVADALTLRAPDGVSASIARASLKGGHEYGAELFRIAALTLDGLEATPEAGAAPIRTASATLSGVADLRAQRIDGAVLSARETVLPLPELYDAPLTLSGLEARFSAAADAGGVTTTIESASVSIDGISAHASGALTLREGGGIAGDVNSAIGPANFAAIPALWPRGAAPGAFRWISENVQGGAIDGVTVDARFDTDFPERDALLLAFDFQDAAVTYVKPMPPIQAGRGRGVATLDRFELTMDSGVVHTPGAAPLLVGSGSSFVIDDLGPRIPDARVSLHVTGPVSAALRLLDQEPLGFITPSGLDIPGVSGEAEVQVALTLPLARDLRVEQVGLDARALVRDYALVAPRVNMPVSGALMKIKATAHEVNIESDALLEGLSARIGYHEKFARPAPGEARGELSVASFLSAEDIAGLGLDLGPAFAGIAALDARVALHDDGAARFDGSIDLGSAQLVLEPLEWRKPIGAPALLTLTGMRDPSGATVLERIGLSGENLAGDGALSIDAAQTIRSARFSRLKLGDAMDVALSYQSDGAGGATIDVSGGLLDLRRPFQSALDASPGGASTAPAQGGPAKSVSLRVARAFLRDDLTVYNLNATAQLSGETLMVAEAHGDLNGSAPTTFTARRGQGGLALQLTAPDAGAFVRAADVFSGAYDGALTIAATASDGPGGGLRGVIRVNDVVFHDAPTMERILSGGAMAGLMSEIASGGLSFSKVELPFESAGSRWRISRGVAYGPSLGLTLDGSYDVEARDLDLSGSLSPAYAINGALSTVPLIGDILTGGEGGGVFGLTFTVRGDADSPDVRVNPLSALAPGFLRGVVSGVMDEQPILNRPSAPAAPQAFGGGFVAGSER